MSPPSDALEAGRAALAGIDAALAARPHKDDDVLSAAVQSLTAFRETLIAAARAGAPEGPERARLETLNAVLGVVLGVHFPIGPTSWEELEQARGWLAGLLAA